MEIKEIQEENRVRLKKFDKRYFDQLTGKGFTGHTEIVKIKGYAIPTQYLTKEVASNPLYVLAKKCKSLQGLKAKLNEQLEKSGSSDRLDDDEVSDMLFLTRCQRDPAFAFITCFKIKAKATGDMIPFALNYAQRVTLDVLESMRENGMPVKMVLVKARQWGGSTLVRMYFNWVQMFVKEGWNSIIIAQTKDTARRIMSMYTQVLKYFPSFLFGTTELNFKPFEGSANDRIIEDAQGNEIRRNVTTIASYLNFENTRGADIALAHYSEVAYWKTTPSRSAEKVVTNIQGNLLEAPLTVEVLESSANGNSGFFYDEYKLAKQGKSGRTALFIPFFYIENDMKYFRGQVDQTRFIKQLIEHRSEEVPPDETHESGAFLWKLWMKGATLEHINWYVSKRTSVHSHDAMASEAPMDDVECFAFSGHSVFSYEHVEAMRDEYAKIPVWRGNITATETEMKAKNGQSNWVLIEPHMSENPTGDFYVWKHPDKLKTQNQYLVAVDVGGRGEKADYSVITVINRLSKNVTGKLEVVARWRGHLRYDLMAMKAVAIARYYKDALLVYESNTFDKKQAEANDYVEQGDHILGILNIVKGKYKNLYKRPATDAEDIKKGITHKVGFQTNRKTKQEMVDLFVKEFEDGRFIDPDYRFYQEAEIYEQRTDGSYGNIQGKDNHDDIVMTDMIGALIESKMPDCILSDGIERKETRMFPGTRNESAI